MICAFLQAEELRMHADTALAIGNAAGAVTLLDRALHFTPLNPAALSDRALAEWTLGEHKAAELSATMALAQDDGLISAYQHRAAARKDQGNYEVGSAGCMVIVPLALGDEKRHILCCRRV